MLSNEAIGVLSLLATVVCYAINKQLYRKYPSPFLMPILVTPLVLIATTVAFALPLYEHRAMLRKHWLSITTGVMVASCVSISTTVWFAHAFGLDETLQKGLAVRSITTPFAIEAERVLGGPTDLAALFVVMTGIAGMLIGEVLLRVLPHVRSKLATGAILGGAAHGTGVAKARQFGDVQAVVASLVMMIAGAVNVLAAPFVRQVFF